MEAFDTINSPLEFRVVGEVERQGKNVFTLIKSSKTSQAFKIEVTYGDYEWTIYRFDGQIVDMYKQVIVTVIESEYLDSKICSSSKESTTKSITCFGFSFFMQCTGEILKSLFE